MEEFYGTLIIVTAVLAGTYNSLNQISLCMIQLEWVVNDAPLSSPSTSTNKMTSKPQIKKQEQYVIGTTVVSMDSNAGEGRLN